MQNSFQNAILFLRENEMEKINRKKILSIIAICLVSLLFLLGIVFTIVKEAQYDKADNYSQSQEEIDKYLDKLDKK